MRKTILIAVLVVLLLAGCAGVGVSVYFSKQLDDAWAAHQVLLAKRDDMLAQVDQWSLTVTEQQEIVGTYTLAQLGLREQVCAAIDSRYSETDLLTPEAFEQLPKNTRFQWEKETHPVVTAVTVEPEDVNVEPILEDLRRVPRTEAENAYLYFEDRAYHLQPEVPGNALDEQSVRALLASALAEVNVGKGYDPAQTVEITDTGCYLQPEVTVENGGFDMAARLAEDLRLAETVISFHGKLESVSAQRRGEMVQVGQDGSLTVNEEAVRAYVAELAERYREENTLFWLDSYAGGWIQIPFLPCSYTLREEPLAEALTAWLLELRGGVIEAEFDCVDDRGKPLELGGTYIEVDMNNQQMTYYRDGQVVVHTDIVTGNAIGNWTPRGLYKTYDYQTNQQLIGPDYNVHVDYWIRLVGNYGIHDATWRDEFGGKIYYDDGSHGCINTPLEAMRIIFEEAEEGTPTLLYGGYPVENLAEYLQQKNP